MLKEIKSYHLYTLLAAIRFLYKPAIETQPFGQLALKANMQRYNIQQTQKS